MVKDNKQNNFHVYARVVPLVLLLLILAGRVEADPVSAERAGNAALKFMQANTGQDREAGSGPLCIAKVFAVPGETQPVFYIFNLNPQGWVIVSADDRAYPIIAYSPKGSYAVTDHPPAFDAWMERIRREISKAVENRSEPLEKTRRAWEQLDGP